MGRPERCIRHETHYEYSAPLQYALQHLCLDAAGQRTRRWGWRLSARRAICMRSATARQPRAQLEHGAPGRAGTSTAAASRRRAWCAPRRRRTGGRASPRRTGPVPAQHRADAARRALAELGRDHLVGRRRPMPMRCCAGRCRGRRAWSTRPAASRMSAPRRLRRLRWAPASGTRPMSSSPPCGRLPARYVSGYFHLAEPGTRQPRLGRCLHRRRRRRWLSSTSRTAARWTSATCMGRRPRLRRLRPGARRARGRRRREPLSVRVRTSTLPAPRRADVLEPLNVHPRALNHVTHYRYDRPIHLRAAGRAACLRPAPSGTRILSYFDACGASGHFLSTGSRIRESQNFTRPAGVPGQDHELPHRGRPRRRDVGAGTRSTSSSSPRRALPFEYDPSLAHGSRPTA